MAQAVQKIGNSLVTKIPRLVQGTTNFAKPKLETFWKYARVELKPPSPGEMGEVSKGFTKLTQAAVTGKWKQASVREATINGLIAFEVLCWFFVGECLGKGSLVGYQIPGACKFELHF